MPKVTNVYAKVAQTGSIYATASKTLQEYAEQVQKKDEQVPRYSNHYRNPMLLSCRDWLRRGRYIKLFVNPQDIRYTIPRRGTVTKTAAGAVRNTWRNRFRNTYVDEFDLGLTFHTGNILPSAGIQDVPMNTLDNLERAVAAISIPPGLKNFYEFKELLDQPTLMGQTENRHIMVHHSRVYPRIRFEGWFKEEPITYTESVQDGNVLRWEATFQVYNTYPWIANSYQLEAVYRSWLEQEGMGEAIGYDNAAVLNAFRADRDVPKDIETAQGPPPPQPTK